MPALRVQIPYYYYYYYYRAPRSRTMWRRGVGRYSLAAPFTTPLAAPAPPAEPLASLSLRWPLLRILLGKLHRRALCAFVLAFDALRGVLGRRIFRFSFYLWRSFPAAQRFRLLNLSSSGFHKPGNVPRIAGFHLLILCSPHSHAAAVAAAEIVPAEAQWSTFRVTL